MGEFESYRSNGFLLHQSGSLAEVKRVGALLAESADLEDNYQLGIIADIAAGSHMSAQIVALRGLETACWAMPELSPALQVPIRSIKEPYMDRVQEDLADLNKYLSERPGLLLAVRVIDGQKLVHIIDSVDLVDDGQSLPVLGLFESERAVKDLHHVMCAISKLTMPEQDFLKSYDY